MRATEAILLTWVALKIRVTCENRTEILHHKERRIRQIEVKIYLFIMSYEKYL